MGSGWKSEGPGFKPRQLQATFDLGLPKKIKSDYPSQQQCAFNEKKIARRTLKALKNVFGKISFYLFLEKLVEPLTISCP